MRLALAATLALAGCVEEIATSAPPPVVSDYNGHVVKVIYHQYPLGERYRESPVYAVAKQTCGGEATYQGTRQVASYQGEHVFLCKR